MEEERREEREEEEELCEDSVEFLFEREAGAGVVLDFFLAGEAVGRD